MHRFRTRSLASGEIASMALSDSRARDRRPAHLTLGLSVDVTRVNTHATHTHVHLPLYVALRRSTSLYDMLRELAKTIIPRSQWAASYVDVMPTARHAKVAASWGGAGLFTVFWLIGDDSFCWLKNTIVGGPEEEDK